MDEAGLANQLEDNVDTPFFSGCSKQNVDNTFFEWQTDSITAGAVNRKIEGDDAIAATARVLPTRLGNYAQISQYVNQTKFIPWSFMQ